MNKWCNSNNSMESFLLEYQQLLPFMMSPAATATNLFIPSLFGTSPAAGPFMISSTAATTAANVIPPQYRKLFIGGLNHETTDDQLRDYYSKWGNVVDCIVIRDPVSRCSRGFGFVTFAMPEMADIAMAERPHTIGGKIVDPKRAIPREQMLQAVNYPPAFLDVESPSECKLFLSGIHWDFHTVDALRNYFEQFGEVQQVEIIGHPRGYGFVAFDERVSVLKCLEHSRSHVINGKKIDVRENDSSDGRLPLCSPPLHIAVATTRNGGGHHLRSQQNMEHYNYRKQYGSAGGHHGQGSTGSMGSQGSQTHSPVESVPGSPK